MQQVWKNRWRKTVWTVLGVSTLCLLVAAVYQKNNKACTGIEVAMIHNENNFFVDEKELVALLKSQGAVEGQKIEKIHLNKLEKKLEKNKWIENAELFFDNRQVLQVRIEEKEPIARIFTSGGSSFYIDSTCMRLPLSDKMSARVPMFTSFPSDKENLSRPDSELMVSVKELAMFIRSDDFWKAQVAQVDITSNGFEMIPTVGTHVVVLGNAGDYQRKFDRLFSFYKQVWTKVGFEKYDRLDVQYEGQVVATLTGSAPVSIDTVKASAVYSTLLAEDKQPIDSMLVAKKVQTVITRPAKKDSAKSNATNVSRVKQLPPSINKSIIKEQVTVAANKQSAIKVPATIKGIYKSNGKDNQMNSKATAKPIDKKMPKAVLKKAV